MLKFPWQRLEEVSLAPMVIIRNKANQNPASTLVAGNRLEVDAQCSALVNGKRVGELLARRIDYEQVVHTACGNALRKAGVLLTDNGYPVVPAKGQEASSQLTLEEALGPKRWLLERNATRAFSRSLREQLASVGVSPDAIGGALIQIRDTEVDPEVAKAIADRQTLAEQVKGSESLLAIARNKAAAAGTGNASAVRKYLADLRGVTPEAVGSISTDEALRVQHALNAAKLVESGNVGWGVAGIEGLSVSPPKR